jgi:hypothetical protein
VHRSAQVVYMDRANVDDLKRQFSDVGERIFLPDLIGDAAELPSPPVAWISECTLNFMGMSVRRLIDD